MFATENNNDFSTLIFGKLLKNQNLIYPDFGDKTTGVFNQSNEADLIIAKINYDYRSEQIKKGKIFEKFEEILNENLDKITDLVRNIPGIKNASLRITNSESIYVKLKLEHGRKIYFEVFFGDTENSEETINFAYNIIQDKTIIDNEFGMIDEMIIKLKEKFIPKLKFLRSNILVSSALTISTEEDIDISSDGTTDDTIFALLMNTPNNVSYDVSS
ncbi:MAG: hypothetical protein K9H06_15625 [Melioribacteraceae bacterium]|nr:hypothetical protein [Melioribacteraceae bacterium]MCF8420352.1 hypothetical protein [Melioribacteraceae bacterium]